MLVTVLVWKVTNNNPAWGTGDNMADMLIIAEMGQVSMTHEQMLTLGVN